MCRLLDTILFHLFISILFYKNVFAEILAQFYLCNSEVNACLYVEVNIVSCGMYRIFIFLTTYACLEFAIFIKEA